ncbi:MAG: hypothetical protein Q9194_005135 [Teloschistes cf. exilis]
MLIAQAVIICVGTVHAGHGIHVWNLHLDSVYALLYWTNINAIVLAPEEFLVGLSILLQYLRIFVPHRRNAQVMYHAIYALIASNFAFYLARFVGLIAFCVPREKLWKPVGHHLRRSVLSLMSRRSAPDNLRPLPLCTLDMWMSLYMFADIPYTGSGSPEDTATTPIPGIGLNLEVCAATVASCAPVLPRFFQQHGHQITGLFHLPQAAAIMKRSKHFRLSSTTRPRDSHEDPSQTSPPRVPKYNRALRKQKPGGDSFFIAEDGLPLNQISPTDSSRWL